MPRVDSVNDAIVEVLRRLGDVHFVERVETIDGIAQHHDEAALWQHLLDELRVRGRHSSVSSRVGRGHGAAVVYAGSPCGVEVPLVDGVRAVITNDQRHLLIVAVPQVMQRHLVRIYVIKVNVVYCMFQVVAVFRWMIFKPVSI